MHEERPSAQRVTWRMLRNTAPSESLCKLPYPSGSPWISRSKLLLPTSNLQIITHIGSFGRIRVGFVGVNHVLVKKYVLRVFIPTIQLLKV